MSKASRRRDSRSTLNLAPQRERVNPGRSTISAAQARRDLIEALPSVVYQGRAERSRPKLDAAHAAPLSRPAASKRPAVPDRPARQLDLRKPDTENCKQRPVSSRGSGGSRPFVPWCSRKG